MSSMFCEDLWMFTHVHPFPYTFLCSYLNIILSPVRSTISHYIGSRHRFRRQRRRRRGRRQQETLLHHLCLRGALGARRCGARLGSKGCHGKIGKYAWWFSRIFMGQIRKIWHFDGVKHRFVGIYGMTNANNSRWMLSFHWGPPSPGGSERVPRPLDFSLVG